MLFQDLSGGPYPVMVFIHGGGLVYGANFQYAGHFMADKDVVVVIPNYRLDIFGKKNCKEGNAFSCFLWQVSFMKL